jgi:hypothetical protein
MVVLWMYTLVTAHPIARRPGLHSNNGVLEFLRIMAAGSEEVTTVTLETDVICRQILAKQYNGVHTPPSKYTLIYRILL